MWWLGGGGGDEDWSPLRTGAFIIVCQVSVLCFSTGYIV